MEKKDLAEMLVAAIIEPKIIMAAMLKSMTEQHGKLVDFQKVGYYSYELYRMPDNKWAAISTNSKLKCAKLKKKPRHYLTSGQTQKWE